MGTEEIASVVMGSPSVIVVQVTEPYRYYVLVEVGNVFGTLWGGIYDNLDQAKARARSMITRGSAKRVVIHEIVGN